MIFYEVSNSVKDQVNYYDSKAVKNKKRSLLFFGIGFATLGIGFWTGSMVLYASALAMILGIGELISYELSRSKSFTYLCGYEGENTLKNFLLKNFSNDYTAYFGVPIPKLGDIDCLLVGPKGIFVIEAKNYRGNLFFKKGLLYRTKITSKGKKYTEILKKPRIQVERGVEFVKRLLKKKVPVRGIIVFTNEKLTTEFSKCLKLSKKPWVGACKIEDLESLILDSQINLSKAELTEINELIRKKFLNKISETKKISTYYG